MSLLPTAIFNRFPPKLCRLLARKANGHRAMTNRDIALASGLSKSYVVKITGLSTWDSLPLGTIERFTGACGVNLMDTADQIEFWRGRKKVYLSNATAAQRRMFGRLMAELSGNVKGQAGAVADRAGDRP